MDNLTREELLKTYQGIRSLQVGALPPEIGVSQLNDMSDGALIRRIERHGRKIENGETVGTNQPSGTDLNLRFTDDSSGLPVPPNTSLIAARLVLNKATQGGNPDMVQFHALLALYGSDDVNFDDEFSDDRILSDDEIAAAQIILDNDLQIAPARAAFENARHAQEEAQQAANEAAEAAAKEAQQAVTRQEDLEENIDSALAARGLIDPEKIGNLTEMERARGLNELMTNEAEYMQQEGVFGNGRLRLNHVQDKAFGTEGWKVQEGALEVATAGLHDMHMGEEVQTWLESGDLNQIKMAQSVLGLPATGQIDQTTFDEGNAYIQEGYETDVTKLDFVENITGSTNPSMLYRAANEGRIYTPDIDTAEGKAILTTAGMDEFDIEDIMFAPTANELSELRASLGETEPTAEQQELLNSETREEIISERYMSDPSFYTTVMEARNELAENISLDPSKAEVMDTIVNAARVEAPTPEVSILGEGDYNISSTLYEAGGSNTISFFNNLPTARLPGVQPESLDITDGEYRDLRSMVSAKAQIQAYIDDPQSVVANSYAGSLPHAKNSIGNLRTHITNTYESMTSETRNEIENYIQAPSTPLSVGSLTGDLTVDESGANFQAGAVRGGALPDTGIFGNGYTPQDGNAAGLKPAIENTLNGPSGMA